MNRFIRFLCLCLLVVGGGGADASGQLVGGELQRDVVITLDSGEILKGPLIEQTAEIYKLDHVILGEITIPAVRIVSVIEIEPGKPDILEAQQPPTTTDKPAEPPVGQEPVAIPQPKPEESEKKVEEAPKGKPAPEKKPEAEAKSKPKPVWSGSIETGVNGSTGNTELQRARLNFDAKRKKEGETLDLRFRYQAAQTRGETSENRLFGRAKNDWATAKAKWRVFVEGSVERDQFLDFDWRLTGNSGLSFDAIKNDKTSLTFRGGLGGSIEFGSDKDGFDPEGTIAFELRHKINKNMSLTANGELIPDLNDTGEFRTRIYSAVDTNLDETGKWKLRIGIEDRYESNPTRAKKNDFDYFVSVVYRF